MTELQQKTVNQIKDSYFLAESIYKRSFPFPEIRFDIKEKSNLGGYAFYNENIIRLNNYFLEKYQDFFIAKTVIHEVAHLVSFRVYGKLGQGHGRFWKCVARQLGTESNRCHSYTNENLFIYICSCRKHSLSLTKHNKIKKGINYRCRKCKGVLCFLRKGNDNEENV